MALGEIVFAHGRPAEMDVVSGRFSGSSPKEFLQSRIFKDQLKRSLWTRLRKWWAFRRGSEYMPMRTLETVMNDIADTLVISSGGSKREVYVAHSSVVLLSARGGFFNSTPLDVLEGTIQEALAHRLEGKFDPEIGLRISCSEVDFLKGDEIRAYLGTAVHVPKRGEEPIGHVRFYPISEDAHYVEPQLVDGRLAGIYRHQSSLICATHPNSAHAWLDLGDQGLSREANLTFPRDLHRNLPRLYDKENHIIVDFRPMSRNDLPGQADLGWEVHFPAGPAGQLVVSFDHRPFAPKKHPVRNGQKNAAITAIELDFDLLGQEADWGWINVDAQSMLCTSSFDTPNLALEFDRRKKKSSVFSWVAHGPLRPFKRSGFQTQQLSPNRVQFFRADRKPIGYLPWPSVPVQVAFDNLGNVEDRAVLDWLDFAGSVCVENTKIGLAAAYADRDSESLKIGDDNRQTNERIIRIGPLVLTLDD